MSAHWSEKFSTPPDMVNIGSRRTRDWIADPNHRFENNYVSLPPWWREESVLTESGILAIEDPKPSGCRVLYAPTPPWARRDGAPTGVGAALGVHGDPHCRHPPLRAGP